MFKFFKEKLGKFIQKTGEEIEEKPEEEPIKLKEKEEKQEAEEKEKTFLTTITKAAEETKEKITKQEAEEEKPKKEISGESEAAQEIEKEIEAAEEEDEVTKEIRRIEEDEKEIEKEIIAEEEKRGFFKKIKGKIGAVKISEEKFEEIFSELEMLLLENNVALEVVEKIKEDMKKEIVEKDIQKNELDVEIQNALKKSLRDVLIAPFDIIEKIRFSGKFGKDPFVIVFFGINGSGKTTTIAKIASLLKKNKMSCVLAASDTFRAASIEQLNKHGEALEAKVISQEYGADPAAVGFDAIKYAKAHNIEVVLIDTAGRMHTKDDLMREMEKIARVTSPDLKIFVAESITGNDAIEQAKNFNKAVGIDGIILSKADVDEKGGTSISVGYVTQKPILFLGTGQEYEKLDKFDKSKIIEGLGL